jgi:hypothetical protein
MIQPIIDPLCLRIRNPVSGKYDKIVMAGGLDQDKSPVKSTEILDLVSLMWEPGIVKRVSWFKSSLLLRITIENTNEYQFLIKTKDSILIEKFIQQIEKKVPSVAWLGRLTQTLS